MRHEVIEEYFYDNDQNGQDGIFDKIEYKRINTPVSALEIIILYSAVLYNL